MDMDMDMDMDLMDMDMDMDMDLGMDMSMSITTPREGVAQGMVTGTEMSFGASLTIGVRPRIGGDVPSVVVPERVGRAR